MRHVADIMYKALSNRDGYISTKDLAASMNVLDSALNMSDRLMRGRDGEPSLIESCSREIFEATGFFIVTRMSEPAGIRLTNSKEDLQAAKEQWSSFLWHLKRRVDEYEFYEKHLDGKTFGPLFDGV
jgi:hypothetical protein